jgi:hypothetical protein
LDGENTNIEFDEVLFVCARERILDASLLNGVEYKRTIIYRTYGNALSKHFNPPA